MHCFLYYARDPNRDRTKQRWNDWISCWFSYIFAPHTPTHLHRKTFPLLCCASQKSFFSIMDFFRPLELELCLHSTPNSENPWSSYFSIILSTFKRDLVTDKDRYLRNECDTTKTLRNFFDLRKIFTFCELPPSSSGSQAWFKAQNAQLTPRRTTRHYHRQFFKWDCEPRSFCFERE